MSRFNAVTLFPAMCSAVSECGITARARKRGLWDIGLWNPRDEVHDPHRTVDDRPFGGGPGMVLMADPLARTADRIRRAGNRGRVISYAPSGKKLEDRDIAGIVERDEPLVLVCGRYEGIDERFREDYVNTQYCIGDFVLSGGELPALCLIDAVVRRIPGAIRDLSTSDESFATGLLDYPHYTRPEAWRGKKVPDVLLSGDHAAVDRWNRDRALEATCKFRPDLVKIARSCGSLSKADEKSVREIVRRLKEEASPSGAKAPGA